MTEMQFELVPEKIEDPPITMVPLDYLPPNEELNTDEPPASMVNSIRKRGVYHPILLIERNGHGPRSPYPYKLAAGRGRIWAARLAGLKDIPARIYSAGYTVDSVITLEENTIRRRNPMADVDAIRKLMGMGLTETEICDETGLSHQTFRKRLILLNLIPALDEAWRGGRMRVTAAERAAKLTPDRQRKLVDVLRQNGRIAGDDVAEANRAEKLDAVSEFPADLFEDPDDPHEQRRREARSLAARIATLVPSALLADVQELVAKINGADYSEDGEEEAENGEKQRGANDW